MRLSVVKGASVASLRSFLNDGVKLGSTVITVGWKPSRVATAERYIHPCHIAPGALAHQFLPEAHRVSALLRRWILGMHQGSVADTHR